MVTASVLIQSSNFLSYAVPTVMVASDLRQVYQQEGYDNAIEKIKIMVGLVVAQRIGNYFFKKWIPFTDSSGQFMIACQCLTRAYYRYQHKKGSSYALGGVALTTSIVGYTAIAARTHSIFDLALGGAGGFCLGTLWNFKLDN